MDVYEIDTDSIGKRIKTPQLFAPKVSAAVTVSYTIPTIKLAVNLTSRLNGPMYLPVVPNDFRSATSPFYGIINL